MLPSVVSREAMEAVRQQLKAQFPSTTSGFLRSDASNAINDLLDKSGEVFKGPYLSFGLPFLKSEDDYQALFDHVEIPYSPYLHQLKAFRRLSGGAPQPTLVATGTGSGKTECFMYPVLDYCAASNAKGIKAVVIYPMNALAQDQARRFAKEIFNQKGLTGKVRVGLYTGDSETSSRKRMMEDEVITDKVTLRNDPPDILLTNYKMLDFLLIRPSDRELWRHNEPSTLRFLVVDELHTFDGAQGTDLACLIRRLKDRLDVGDELGCVGTSATVGDDVGALTEYASRVFDTDFTVDSVLREERETASEFLPAASDRQWPDVEDLTSFAVNDYTTREDYVNAAVALWFSDGDEGKSGSAFVNLFSADEALAQAACTKLGAELKALGPFQQLLQESSSILNTEQYAAQLSGKLGFDLPIAIVGIESLVALASTARDGGQPMVSVRNQLWLRELRRMVATVESTPKLQFHDDLSDREEGSAISLPVIHCNECHATGWIAMRKPQSRDLVHELRAVYQGFFAGLADTVAIYIANDEQPVKRCVEEMLCSGCGTLNGKSAERCSSCDRENLLAVFLPDMTRVHTEHAAQRRRFHRDCPYCEKSGSLLILGSRAATLSSVAINQLFNSPHNSDAKLIAFSDSVQDAAHRAGFFEARTYRQVLRSALATAAVDAGFSTLDELINGIGSYWQQRFKNDNRGMDDFTATFLAPDSGWLKDWELLQTTGNLPKSSDIVEKFVLPRLKWEALLEFGLHSRRGRTLERMGIAIVYADPALIEQLVDSVLEPLREHIVELRDLDSSVLRQFVLGVFWRMRTRGAFYNPTLDGYMAHGGNPFTLRREYHLPRYGQNSPLPSFVSLAKVTENFDYVVASKGATWFEHWYNKTLGSDGNELASASMAQVFSALFKKAASGLNLLNEHDLRGQSYWSLNADAWQLSADVTTMVCSSCRHRIQVPGEVSEQWEDMPCLRTGCIGKQAPLDEALVVGQKHSTLAPTRLITAEHTAVLDAATRKQVEDSFKRSPGNTWDINLLSATPTMEMGVDIGDLSSVLLCSVPPAQANYLQRIGRAGRKDGNAFNLTIANGVPHDLYFFAEPMEMMRGAVEPPGVFLGAVAVLERQLVAYCFDQWVQTGIDKDAIPTDLKDVLDAVENGSSTIFPLNFLSYVESERGAISRKFLNLFPDLPASAMDQLNLFLYGQYDQNGGTPGITFRISTKLNEKIKQRDNFKKDIAQLKREIDRLKKLPQDEATINDIQAITSERSALMRLVSSINKQYTLNYFTDEGLLPNYSFPEEGVKLNSVIFRRKEISEGDDDKNASPYERIELEIRRPAQVALRELAPFNRFYGNSRQVEIDQIEIRSTTVENWRFCPRCNYGEHLVPVDNKNSCPRCGNADWSDGEQRMTLLRLREVYANASDRDSRISDDSDDREPVFFNRQFLFDLDPSAIEEGWRISDETWPFGFEYVSKAAFREINFGRQTDGGQTIQIAGDSSTRQGFQVCMECGKVKMPRKNVDDNHTRRCSMRGKEEEEQKKKRFESLYLYRELHSEAIRLLLPFAEVVQSKTRLHSFISALHLGLKRYFHGNVDHIQVMHYSEPQGTTDLRRQYLVLLDSVPGGTGYLKDLLKKPEEFKTMLEHSQQVLSNCGCRKEDGKDGCYRCLYAYRDSQHLDVLSRKSALDVINGILDRWEQLQPLDDGESLHHTNVNALFDSEMERMFIDKLANRAFCTIEPQSVNGKPGYMFTTRAQAGDRRVRWSIELQVEFGDDQGVAKWSKPDFVMRCLSGSEPVKPIAIFTDGFEHHAESQAEDTSKRYAIMLAGEYRVWTITWSDLPSHDEQPEYLLERWFEQAFSRESSAIYNMIVKESERPGYGQQASMTRQPTFEQLMYLLAKPQMAEAIYTDYALSRAVGLLDMAASGDSETVLQKAGSWLPEPWQERYVTEDLLVGLHELPAASAVTVFVAIPQAAVRSNMKNPVASVCLRLDDAETSSREFKETWQQFWSAANILQYLPQFLPASRKGIEGRVYADIIENQPDAEEIAADTLSQEWQDAMEYSNYPKQLLELDRAGVTVPEIGHEVISGIEAIGELEWGWIDSKVGLAIGMSDDQIKLFGKEGWKVVADVEDVSLQQLITWLS